MNPAFYPGSFDPITFGHLDVIERAIKVFGFLHIVVMDNPRKAYLFSKEERISLIAKCVGEFTKDFAVESHEGLMVDYCAKSGIYTAVRGLRALTDFDYEFQMALTNRAMNEKVESVLFVTNINYTFLSSSIVKEIASFHGDISDLVPKPVEDMLKGKYGPGNG
jgi:pantetheine-phosphate adenylyltransferase